MWAWELSIYIDVPMRSSGTDESNVQAMTITRSRKRRNIWHLDLYFGHHWYGPLWK